MQPDEISHTPLPVVVVVAPSGNIVSAVSSSSYASATVNRRALRAEEKSLLYALGG